MSRDPRVDAYVAKAAPFAQPILARLRAAIHAACPDATETIKWGRPFFDYRGQPLCMIAAFKAHAAFGLWPRGGAGDGAGRGGAAAPAGEGRGPFGEYGKLASLADVPAGDVLARLLREAMALIEAGAKTARKPVAPRPAAEPPADLLSALDATPGARAWFDAFAPGQRREYVDWVTEAKRAETRARRVAQAAEWIGEGKKRNWKYAGC